MKAFEVVLMEDVSCGTESSLLEAEVAFVRCQKIAAPTGRDLMGECQGIADVIVHRYPARC